MRDRTGMEQAINKDKTNKNVRMSFKLYATFDATTTVK